MTIPTPEKSYQFDVRIVYADKSLGYFWWSIANAMTGFARSPWVRSSSYGNWDSPYGLVTSIDNGDTGSTRRDWIVLRQVGTGAQLLIDLNMNGYRDVTNTIVVTPPNPGLARVYWSALGGFTGGSSTSRPTAPDETRLDINNASWTTNPGYDGHVWVQGYADHGDWTAARSSWEETGLLPLPGVGFAVIHSTDGMVTHVLFKNSDDPRNNHVDSFWSFSRAKTGGVETDDIWANPLVALAVSGGGFPAPTSYDNFYRESSFAYVDTYVSSTRVPRHPFLTSDNVNGVPIGEDFETDTAFPEDVEWPLVPIGLYVKYNAPAGAFQAQLGYMQDLWWGASQLSSSAYGGAQSFFAYPREGDLAQLLQVGMFVFPWNGLVPWQGQAPGAFVAETTEKAFVHQAQERRIDADSWVHKANPAFLSPDWVSELGSDLSTAPRWYHSVIALKSGPDAGKVLVCGGVELEAAANNLRTAIYNPASNTWTAKGNLPAQASKEDVGFSTFAFNIFSEWLGSNFGDIHSGAVELDDGTVLSAGPVASYRYNQGTGLWSATGNTPGSVDSQMDVIYGLYRVPGGAVMVYTHTAGAPLMSTVKTMRFINASNTWGAGETLPLPSVQDLWEVPTWQLSDGSILLIVAPNESDAGAVAHYGECYRSDASGANFAQVASLPNGAQETHYAGVTMPVSGNFMLIGGVSTPTGDGHDDSFNSNVSRKVRVFSIGANSWSVSGTPAPFSTFGQTAVALPDGRIVFREKYIKGSKFLTTNEWVEAGASGIGVYDETDGRWYGFQRPLVVARGPGSGPLVVVPGGTSYTGLDGLTHTEYIWTFTDIPFVIDIPISLSYLVNVNGNILSYCAAVSAPGTGGGVGGGGSDVAVVPVAGVGAGTDGEDIWLDVASPSGVDRVVTAAGDWLMVSGEEALRQSLKRRLITSPGEWALVPDYGVGAREFVKAAGSKSKRDELISRIHAQFIRDPRVTKVTQVIVDSTNPELLVVRIDVKTRLRPDDAVPLSVQVEVN